MGELGPGEIIHNKPRIAERVKKALHERYTVEGRFGREEEQFRKVLESVPEEDRAEALERLKNGLEGDVRKTIMTDAVVAAAVVVTGIIVFENREPIVKTIRTIVSKDNGKTPERTPAQWAEIFRKEQLISGIVNTSLKDELYRAGPYTFRGDDQGTYAFHVAEQVPAAIDPDIHVLRDFAGDNPDGMRLASITGQIAMAADNVVDGRKGNLLCIGHGKDVPLLRKLSNSIGLVYQAMTDPAYMKGYEHPRNGNIIDDRYKPIAWSIVLPETIGLPFLKLVMKNPNLLDQTMRSYCDGLFSDFDLVQESRLVVRESGSLLNPGRITGMFNRVTEAMFSPPVGTARLLKQYRAPNGEIRLSDEYK